MLRFLSLRHLSRERLSEHCWLDDSRSVREAFVLEKFLQHECER